MSRLRQSVAVLLCLTVLLALPALCLHLIATHAEPDEISCAQAHGSVAMQPMPMGGATGKDLEPLPSPLPHACCAAHPLPVALLAAVTSLPDLPVVALPAIDEPGTPAQPYRSQHSPSVSPPLPPLGTLLRI